jgi:hypothetical protein
MRILELPTPLATHAYYLPRSMDLDDEALALAADQKLI